MKEVNLTCIECPLGCDITAKLDGEKVVRIDGNSCPRGKIYAEAEVICPKRVITTTVKTQDGRMLPVKSDKPIEKSKTFEAMKIINGVTVKTPIKIGETVIENIYEGVNVVACANLK
ncbi:MAG: DUF1667 domain-containing protein [Clostridiales bacterium]|nr:DUF1667 domain-containing protein [Clostridiales bacterium]